MGTKLILTENQIKSLMDNVLNENVYGDKFGTEVECTVFHPGLKYNGGEVEDVNISNFHVTYDIDMEYRRFGIKGISVYNIDGPKTIEIEVIYYPIDSEDLKEDYVEIPIDWNQNIKRDNDETIPYFGVGRDVEIELINDEKGNIVIKTIHIGCNEM